jgi:hypothetical protein
MTDEEMKALKENFEIIEKRLNDIEAKLNKKEGEKVEKVDEGMKFEELPPDLKEPKEKDRSSEIKSWLDRKVF